MNILIPLAGTAKRFASAGYAFPKPLIEVLGKPMIQWVVENLAPLGGRFVFVLSAEDVRAFNLDAMLRILAPDCAVIVQDQPAQGAACSSLLAVDCINGEDELVVAGGDQYLDADLPRFVTGFREAGADAGIFVFPSVHPQFSYARLDPAGTVVEVAEKRPISPLATAGVYWYRRGADFVLSAMDMIAKGDSFNGNYYLCPAFNQMILRNRQIVTAKLETPQFVSFGTPDRVAQINARGLFAA